MGGCHWTRSHEIRGVWQREGLWKNPRAAQISKYCKKKKSVIKKGGGQSQLDGVIITHLIHRLWCGWNNFMPYHSQKLISGGRIIRTSKRLVWENPFPTAINWEGRNTCYKDRASHRRDTAAWVLWRCNTQYYQGRVLWMNRVSSVYGLDQTHRNPYSVLYMGAGRTFVSVQHPPTLSCPCLYGTLCILVWSR